MRILIINTYYYPNVVGGTENSVKILAENLKKGGHEVAVYCVDNEKKEVKIEFINGIKVYRGNSRAYNIKIAMKKEFNKTKKIFNKIVELRNYSIKKDIIKVLNDFNPDVVHTNNIYAISPYIWKIVKSKNIKIVHTLRDYWLLSPKVAMENKDEISIVKKNIYKIYRSYFRYNTKMVDIVTAPSNFTLNTFKEYKYFGNSTFKHITNAIEVNPINVNEIILKKKLREGNEISFIFVGMINRMKGIDVLLKVFSKIDNPLISLTICGDGELVCMVKEYCEEDERIKYEGKLEKSELEKRLKDSDVLIVPSMWDEPFGRVVIEGNQFGNPVIGSNRGGIKEIIETISTGKLFEYSSESELEMLIKEFSDRNNIKKYYDTILNNIEKYSVSYQVKEFEKIYKSGEIV